MSDNPKKKMLDAKRISQQPWEQAYQRRKNARKKKDHLTSAKISQKDPGKKHGRPLLLKRSALLVVDRQKLESTLIKLENAVLQNPTRGKEPIAFCKEWEEKGKPIFNMVLVLFSFNAKVKDTIRRIMNGIDGICTIPELVVKP